jgi:hypothetical protein
LTRATERAIAALWAEAFDGGPYVLTGPLPVSGAVVGGYSGFADNPHGMTLRFTVGSEHRHVELVVERRHQHHRLSEWELTARLLSGLGKDGKLPLPITLERTTVRINVDGRSRAFKGCAAGDSFSVESQIGSLNVKVVCPEGHPGDGFALKKLRGQDLERLVGPERERWNELHRGSRAPKT